jgi:DNA-binding transcriptional LysR family regulator
MELRHLRYFLAVAEHLNFGRAARALHTAQPSLSQQIKQLERELGVPLFERTKRYVTLTTAGRTLLSEAQSIVESVDLLGVRLGDTAGIPSGRLRIGSYPPATIGVLPRVLPSYRAGFPHVDLVVETVDLAEQARALIERRLDVGIMRGPIVDDRLVGVSIAVDFYSVVLPQEHRLAALASVPIAQLDGETFISLREEAGGEFFAGVTDVLQRHGVRVRGALETSDINAIFALVASGAGISIGSTIVSRLQLEGVAFRILTPATEIGTLRVACRRDRRTVPVIASFIEHIQRLELRFDRAFHDRLVIPASST